MGKNKIIAGIITVSMLLPVCAVGVKTLASNTDVKTSSNAGSNSSSNSSSANKKDIEELKKLARTILIEIQNSNYKPLQENLSKPDPSLMRLPMIIKSYSSTLGNFKEVANKAIAVEKENVTNIAVFSVYEKGTLKYNFSFNKEGKIVGYNFNYGPYNQEVGEFKYNGTTSEVGQDELIQFGVNKISGLITTPLKDKVKKDKNTIVLFIAGSGPNNLDEQVNENKPFKDIADSLVKNGYTTFRYNKSTFERAENLKESTIESEYFEDVNAAIKLLHEKYPTHKIVLLGHSQGSMLLPNFYNDNKDNIAGLISVSGTDKSLFDVMIEQYTAMKKEYEAKGATSSVSYLDASIKQLETLKDKKVDDGVPYENMPSSYIVSLNSSHRPELYKEINVPFLGIHGDKDVQVNVLDLKNIESRMAHNKNAKFVVIKGMNHMLLPSLGKSWMEDYQDTRNVQKEFLDEVNQFLDANFDKN